MNHGIETIADIKVGFALPAVAQNFQMIGVGQQLFVEIQDVTVRITFAENRDKPENITFKSVTFAISMNKTFTGELGGGVQRSLHGKGVIFGRRNDIRFAIGTPGGAESNAFDPI